MMRIIFMGTSEFSVSIAKKLQDASYEFVGIFTQPDKPRNRGKKLTPPPMKIFAEEHGIPVFQPMTLKGTVPTDFISEQNIDAIIVASYGQILPESFLSFSKLGAINVHTSLLPKYRGAAPIQRAIMNGEAITGISIMKMDKGLDTGAIYVQREYKLKPTETTESLFERLADLGGDVLVDTLPKIAEGLIPTEQDGSMATYAEKVDKKESHISWHESASKIDCLVRAFFPKPGAFTYHHEKRIKILKAEVVDRSIENRQPGTIIDVGKDHFTVMTGENALKITEVQLEGKRPMSVEAFLQGYNLKCKDRFE